jgi:PAS domain S-box-containing protein
MSRDETPEEQSIAAQSRRALLSMLEDRERAETELRKREAFQNTIIDMSPFAMWVADPDGTVIRTNHALCEALNLTDEQIVGEYNVFRDGNLEKQGVMPMVRAVFEKHEPARFSIPWIAAEAGDFPFSGGRDLHIDAAMFPIVDEKGQLVNVVCQWVNITERKQAEMRLRQSEARMDAFLSNSPVGLVIFDRQMRYVYINDVLQRINGPSLEEHIGKTVRDIIPKAAPLLEPILEKVLATGEPLIDAELSGEVPSRPGQITHYLVSYFPIPGLDGRPEYIGGVVVEITEREQAKENLATSEQRFRSLYENSPFGILVCELILDDAGKPVDFLHVSSNAATAANTGFNQDDIVGRRASELVPPEVLPDLLVTYGGVVQTGVPASYTRHFALYDRTLDVTAFRLHGNTFIINFIDISERVGAQEELARQHEHLEEEVRERTRDLETIVDAMAGREVRMAELKEEIKALRAELGASDCGLRNAECGFGEGDA